MMRIKDFKTGLPLMLLLLFLSPQLTKTLHIAFVHHHHHFEHINSPGRNLSEHHPRCPICAFEVIEFFEKPLANQFASPSENFSLISIPVLKGCTERIALPFNLRAPPKK